MTPSPKKDPKTKSPTASTEQVAAVDPLQQLLAAMAPLLKFHEDSQTASNDDLRIMYDVRVMRGTDLVAHVVTASTLSGAMDDNRQINCAEDVAAEVSRALTVPLVGKVQKYIGAKELEAQAAAPLPRLPNVPAGDGLDAAVAHAAAQVAAENVAAEQPTLIKE